MLSERRKNRSITNNNLFKLIKALVVLIFCAHLFVAPDAYSLDRFFETFTSEYPGEPLKKIEEKVDTELLHIDTPRIPSEVVFPLPSDNEKIISEDWQDQMQGSQEFSIGVHKNLEQFSDRDWRIFTRPDGKYSWRVVIYSPDAYFTRPHFKEFPTSDTQVYLYGEEGASTLNGPVTKPDVYKGEEFWGPIIKGEFMYIEVIHDSASKTPELYIDKISHGYIDPLSGSFNDLIFKNTYDLIGPYCYNDIACYSDYLKTGVAMMVYEENQETKGCTGALLMDMNSSYRNWFLTAYNCISNNTVANTLQAVFNYRTDQCDGTGTTTYFSVNGATFKTGNTNSGFSLLELPGGTIENVSYLGWTTVDLTQNESAYCSNHSGGYTQSIAFGYGVPNGNYYDAVWQSGTIGPGSEGAPLFNLNGQIVGQLSTLNSSCTNTQGGDKFGKFSAAWNNGLSAYLGPGSDTPPEEPPEIPPDPEPDPDPEPSPPSTGYKVTTDLWIRAVINTVEKGLVEAVWLKGGEDTTSRGDTVIWGHFYANPSDVTWGSANNPDLFVKIWFDVSGRIDVNYFHVSVPDIEVYSDYPYDGFADEQGTTTMSRRYIRQYYDTAGSHSEENFEDGLPAPGYSPAGNPLGYTTINDLRIGAMINTVEKGLIDAVWRLGGQDTTARGDQVVWGHFYASPSDVTWGSSDNPDLYVKIWFDVGGWINVNFFFVSVPDIEVYSELPDEGTYDQKGTTILSDRYIRHDY